jgi:hypothetical protein
MYDRTLPIATRQVELAITTINARCKNYGSPSPQVVHTIVECLDRTVYHPHLDATESMLAEGTFVNPMGNLVPAKPLSVASTSASAQQSHDI